MRLATRVVTRLWIATLIGLPVTARSQATLTVLVRASGGQPLEEALVTVRADSTAPERLLGSGHTDATGRVELRGLPAGQGNLLVRRVGYAPVRRSITLSDAQSDTVRVDLGDWREARLRADSIAAIAHAERVAAARSRMRNWTCAVSPASAHSEAEKAFAWFTSTPPARQLVSARKMPLTHDDFVREFVRPLSSPECKRLAEGLDREVGLETDSIEVYRFGTEFYVPRVFEYGGFLHRDGSISVTFVIPD